MDRIVLDLNRAYVCTRTRYTRYTRCTDIPGIRTADTHTHGGWISEYGDLQDATVEQDLIVCIGWTRGLFE